MPMNQTQARVFTAVVIIALIAICYGPAIRDAIGLGGARPPIAKSIR
jgi:hypothetical protein